MARLFGTDGIRGIANVELKPGLALALGRATAARLLGAGGHLLIGQDTRRSCDMLVASLAAGATSMGSDVYRLGVCPTPALAFVTADLGYGAGIMVSASHNPADDNGLKVLDGRGLKLDGQMEDELEALIWRADELPSPGNAGLGRDLDGRAGMARYVGHRMSLAAAIHADLRVSLDCANGSASVVAPGILAATGCSVAVHFDAPDGININLGCGATAPAALAGKVAASGSDVGFALDGDADRCVAVDERGQVVDGDQLLGIIALDRLGRGVLDEATLVVSVLSNGGLADAVEQAGGRVVRTQVGDKYILDAMLVSGAGVGGEKSGHVIVRQHTTSGDGIVTALEVLDILTRTGRRLSELAATIPLYPQQQRTIPVRHKDEWEADRQLMDAVTAAEAELAGKGRILVRPSGTEPALRIMVEGQDAGRVAQLADELSALAVLRLN
jgi:phosphoglucosamine mutase